MTILVVAVAWALVAVLLDSAWDSWRTGDRGPALVLGLVAMVVAFAGGWELVR